MKKIFIALLAVAALASCAKTEDAYVESQNEIKMAPVTSLTTKAPAVAEFDGAIDGIQYPADEMFTVNAYWTNNSVVDKLYLNNKVFKKSGQYWAGRDDVYYWPKNGTLRFAAYSPSTVEDVQHFPDTDTYVVDYEQTNNTANTVDFMVSPITVPYTAHTAAENVAVVFEHTLAWITLKVKAANADAEKAFRVHEMIINDVQTKGTLFANMEDGVKYDEWKNVNSPLPYAVVTNDFELTTLPTIFEDADRGTVVIPQVPTTLTINYTQKAMYEDDGTTESTPELTNQTLTIPLELDNEQDNKWHPGKHYIYTVVFDLDEIVINPSVADWEDIVVEDKDDQDNGYIYTAADEDDLREALAAKVAEIELTGNIKLTSALNLTYNVAITGGSFSGANCVYVTGETVSFKDVQFNNATGTKQTSVYVRNGNKNITFDGCTFDKYTYEAIQYTAQDSDWVCVTGCTFKATAYRDLHLEMDSDIGTSNAEVKVTNNNFAGESPVYVVIYGFMHERMILENNVTKNPASTVENVGIYDGFNWNNLTLEGFASGEISGNALTASTLLPASVQMTTRATDIHDLQGQVDGRGAYPSVVMTASSAKDFVTTKGGFLKDLNVVGYGNRADNGFATYGVKLSGLEADVNLYNVKVSGFGYALNTGSNSEMHNLVVENSALEGWVSFSSLKSATFINTDFTFGSYFTTVDPTKINVNNGNLKPYVTTTLKNCSFEKGYGLDLTALIAGETVTLTNCTVDGVVLNKDNVHTYMTVDGELTAVTFN